MPETPHVCPAPDWYVRVRDLLGDVVLAAGFAGTDLAELPAHVERIRNEAADAATKLFLVRAMHPREQLLDGREICGRCTDASEDPYPWPCPTMAPLES